MYKRRGRSTLLLCVVLFLTAVLRSGAQAPPPIEIATRPGETPGPIHVTFEPGSDQATLPVFIKLAGGEPLQQIQIYGQLTDCQGQALTVGQVELLQAAADAPLGALSLQPGAGARPARLRVSHMGGLYGDFCGYLAAEIGGIQYTYNDLSVRRPAAPTLTIREADGQGQIHLVTHRPQLDDALFVSETGGKAPVQQVRLTASSLRAEGGEAMSITLDPATFDLAASGSQLVRVLATVPTVGSYRGLLQVRWAGSQQDYDLIVERQAGIDAVTLEAVAPVPRTLVPGLATLLGFLPSPAQLPRWLTGQPWLDSILSYRASDVEIPIVLREAAGRTTEIYAPTLTQLNRVGADGSETQAESSSWVLRDCQGRRIAASGQGGQPSLLTLPSYGTQCLALTISGLKDAGAYKAQISVSSPGGSLASEAVTLRLRDHWLLAALAIFLGALGSYQLRHWLEIGRPRQIGDLAIGRLAKLIRERITTEGDPVRQAMLARLEEVQQLVQVDPQADVDGTIKEVKAQLGDYLAVRAVLDLEPKLESVVPDPAHRAEAAAEIRRIAAMVGGDEPLGNLAAARQAAEALAKKIDGWRQERLREGLQRMREAVQADLEQVKALVLPDQQREELASALAAVQGKCTAASERVDTNPDEAQALYEEARAAYAQVAVLRLRLVLEGQPRPLGFATDDEWRVAREPLVKELDKAAGLDPDHAREGVRRVRQAYLETILTHLRDEAQALKAQLRKKPGTEAQQQALDPILDSLNGALQQVAADPDAAEAAYRQARDAYLAQLPKAQRGRLQDAEGRPAPGAPAQPPGSVDPAGPPGQRVAKGEPLAEVLEPGRIIADINRKDRQALYIVSGVSVLVGLQALWVPNNTFGGLLDYITVFLWGFGLHELNKVALPAAARRLQLPWYPQTGSPGQQQEP
jgi:hypothetical protein